MLLGIAEQLWGDSVVGDASLNTNNGGKIAEIIGNYKVMISFTCGDFALTVGKYGAY